MSGNQFVSDFYNIQDFEIEKLCESKNPYWLKVKDFWDQQKDRKVQFLSQKQASWLSDIEAELEDKWRPQWIEEGEGTECF